MTLRRVLLIVLLATAGMSTLAVTASASNGDSSPTSQLRYILSMLIWLLPLGVALVAVGIGEPARAQQVATSLPLALAMALGGYFLCGFAFQYGGVGLVTQNPALSTFDAEWSPLDLALGPGWGFVGLHGFLLPASLMNEEALALFVSELALVTTATLIPLVTLGGRMPRLPSAFLALLVSCVGYPLVGNWLRGGGWLSRLGETLRLGHGVVDYGLSSPYVVGGGAALAGLIAFGRVRPRHTESPELPVAYLPLNVLIGAILALIGWIVMLLSQPLVSVPGNAGLLIIKALAAVAASILATFFYGWLVRGEPDPGLTGRGILAALVAASAGLPFMPIWAVALTGGLAGLTLAPAMYTIEHILGLDDRGAAVSVHGLAGIWGLIAVALFADGSQGAGWNALNSQDTNALLAQGVTGYLAAPGSAQAVGQLYAQLIGVGAMLLIAALVPWLLLTLAARAYALPPTMRDRARARAAQSRQEREARELLKRQGGGLSVWRRARIAYVRIIASSARRLTARARLRGSRHALAGRSLNPSRPATAIRTRRLRSSR